MKKAIILISFTILLIPLLAWGASGRRDVYLSKTEIITGNYYAAGGVVDIEGKVDGDLLAVGGNVTVKGEITGDVLILGGNIRISGPVGGSIRIVGGNIELDGPVNKNVSIASGSLIITTNSNISGSLSLACGSFNLRGAINGKTDGYLGDAIIAGTMKGDTNLILGPNNSLQIMESALIQGKFTYQAVKPAQVAAAAKLDQPLNYLSYIPTSSGQYNGDWWSKRLVSIFSLLVIALIITTLFPKFLLQVSQTAQIKPWRQMLWGFVWLVVPIPAIVLLAITLIGLPLGLILLVLYMIGIYIVPVLAGTALAVYLKTKPNFSFMANWNLLLLVCVGIVVYKLLTYLPFIGWIVSVIALLWLWGAMMNTLKQLIGNK